MERTLRTVLHASGLRGILAGLAAGALALGGLALMVSTGIGESTSFLNVTGRQAGTVSRILSANLASDEILLSMAPERLIGAAVGR